MIKKFEEIETEELEFKDVWVAINNTILDFLLAPPPSDEEAKELFPLLLASLEGFVQHLLISFYGKENIEVEQVSKEMIDVALKRAQEVVKIKSSKKNYK